jgi:cytochrome oxidase Cu insertion factor (SCO1/SenC/PrrC family)
VKLSPRAQLLLLMGVFALPIVASVVAYNFVQVRPTANYGELIMPPVPVTSRRLETPAGEPFDFRSVAGRWALVASGPADCVARCQEKLVAMRQIRLALGRNASRVERVFVVDDSRKPQAAVLEPFPGMHVALAPAPALPPGAGNDRQHVYLVDPHGNVMMRWPFPGDARRMLKDIERLLKASQIG